MFGKGRETLPYTIACVRKYGDERNRREAGVERRGVCKCEQHSQSTQIKCFKRAITSEIRTQGLVLGTARVPPGFRSTVNGDALSHELDLPLVLIAYTNNTSTMSFRGPKPPSRSLLLYNVGCIV